LVFANFKAILYSSMAKSSSPASSNLLPLRICSHCSCIFCLLI